MPRDLDLRFAPSEKPPTLADGERFRRAAARRLGVAPEALGVVRPTRISFDARRRERSWRVALRVWAPGEEAPPLPRHAPPRLDPPRPGAPHAVVIGSGPAGLFSALDLLAAGIRVTVLERGRDVRARRRYLRRLYRGEEVDPDCNYCFGEGGAGTYSDGKLYTRSGNKRAVRAVLTTLVRHGAPPEILVHGRPHVGSNRLPEVVRELRETLLAGGAEIRFAARAEALITDRSRQRPRVTGVRVRDLERDRVSDLPCAAVVLATGHSALDALRMAAEAGAPLEPKGFAMGVRVEHPQPWLDARQYGGLREDCALPASFYELTTQVEGRGVYSFCMCPGGFVVPSTTGAERVVVNGMSLSRRDSPFANSGLVVSIEPEDWCGRAGERFGWPELLERARAQGWAHSPRGLPRVPADDALFGVRLQHALERVAAVAGGGANRVPAQRTDQLAEGAHAASASLPTSYRPGLTAADLSELLPAGLASRIARGLAVFDGRLPGFASELGQALGVESRTSSPVRVLRDPERLESPGLGGLYPCGEGAGFAGGIVSAAVDGRRVAAALAAALVG